ncbi:MAG: DUF255 domain-containing protein [Granulosicoccaceae bacterium]
MKFSVKNHNKRYPHFISLVCLSGMIFGALLTPTISTADDKPKQSKVVALDENPILIDGLLKALANKGTDYKPRTEHLLSDGSPVYTNRLILEASPYLIQHAHNPVNWYPWGEEAFAAAKDQNKPVFLSIGYATCHWCHVMERESFENLDIAKLLNENYIAIKVDREQLPDIDAMYMTAVMMITGSGGWPMSSWLDEQGRPFYGGTYFPAERFDQLLTRISELWRTDKGVLLEQADQVSAAMNQVNSTSIAANAFGDAEIESALSQAITGFDELNGGFGGAPKFPRESTLYFLLDQAKRNTPDAQNVALSTLNHMANGGIHDHIAGGFHRYSVDSQWLVPHFEKMLYNQAALARNYSQAWQLTADINHHRTATRILDYVLREMRADNQLFYSATDADSEGEEGRFFIWTPEQLEKLLGDDAKLAKQIWNVTGEGSFEGESIIHMDRPLAQVAENNQLSKKALIDKLDKWSNILLTARQLREKPLLDNKSLTSWNGMMISALAEASTALDREDYLSAGIDTANALWKTMVTKDNGIYRSYYEGKTSIEGTQPDYAFFAEGLIALFDATGDKQWLDKAAVLTDEMHNRFWDTANGAYFMGGEQVVGAKLAIRPKDIHDNAQPTGNSIAMRILAKLFKRTGEPRFDARANELIVALSGSIAESPSGFFYFLLGANEHLNGEAGPQQYAARGRVTATAVRKKDTLDVTLSVAPGWHINSDNPNQDYLIPTQLQLENKKPISGAQYPEAVNQALSFEKSILSLFEGKFSITAPIPKDSSDASVFKLQLQACDDKQCLPPETVTLTLGKATVH